VSEFQSHQIHQKIEDISVELPNILYQLIHDFTLFEKKGYLGKMNLTLMTESTILEQKVDFI
jgi:ABC-type tungstate transport system substrate-binding protein